MQNPPPGQQTSTGLAPNIAGALCYITIVGLVFFFLEKDNKFIRFHGMQSVLYAAVGAVVMIALGIINFIIAIAAGVAAAATSSGGLIGSLISLISGLIWMVIPLLYIGGLVFGAIKAYGGATFKFPVIGNLAEKIAGGQ